jgi:hypothetical protein
MFVTFSFRITPFLNNHVDNTTIPILSFSTHSQIDQLSAEEPSLEREIAFLSKLHEYQGWREQGIDLVRSALGFLAFWFVGAAVFGAVEVSRACCLPVILC